MKIYLAIAASIFVSFSFLSNTNFIHSRSAEDSVQTCIVSGEVLDADKVNYVYLNRSIDLCCEVCLRAFKKEPAKYLGSTLHCPVCNDDDAVKDISTSSAGVKYYFCNESCKTKFESSPDEYLEKYKSKD